jgi:hypothetical protein
VLLVRTLGSAVSLQGTEGTGKGWRLVLQAVQVQGMEAVQVFAKQSYMDVRDCLETVRNPHDLAT